LNVLIEKECDLNAQDELGYTALHYAVMKNNFDAVACLIEAQNIDLSVSVKILPKYVE
jgi:ankyrin repeat protein